MHKLVATIDNWWSGDPIEPSLEEIRKMTGETVIEYDRPFARKLLTALWKFWLRHWPIILTLLVATIGLAIQLFIHFDGKAQG